MMILRSQPYVALYETGRGRPMRGAVRYLKGFNFHCELVAWMVLTTADARVRMAGSVLLRPPRQKPASNLQALLNIFEWLTRLQGREFAGVLWLDGVDV